MFVSVCCHGADTITEKIHFSVIGSESKHSVKDKVMNHVVAFCGNLTHAKESFQNLDDSLTVETMQLETRW